MTGEKSGEFRGKTVEAAISAGLAALRLTREEVEVEVIKPGSRGVLGIGAEEALVRLTLSRPGRSEPKAAIKSEATPVARTQAEPLPPQPRAESQPRPAVEPTVKPEPLKTPRPAPVAMPGSADDKMLAVAEQAREFLAGLLERMGLRAAVEVTAQSDAEADEDGSKVPVLNIVGNDLELLIGRQNETVSALEFITRLMVNQHSHTRSSFVVDVNGHRAKRAESLRKLAFRTAEQVMQTNRTMALEPMPPAERRVIHLALRDHPQVYTQSVGEGDRRKVTVVPKKD
jgi:spoIIIJ-associated protein